MKLFSTKRSLSTILDKSFSAPTAEGRILNRRFTKEEIPNIYMLPFKILKEPKLIMFQVKIIHNILPTQSSLFHARITDTDVCPLCKLESQSLKHYVNYMLIVYPLLFGPVFLTGVKKNLIKNWLYLQALFYTAGTKSQITGKCLITVWLWSNIMFLLRAYVTACWTLTFFYCV